MLLLLLTAFTLGAAHAVAPDHLAAVGVFVSHARSPREALAHGARWGIGHALTLCVAGLAVLFVSKEWPQLLSVRAEWLVGVVLIVLGARTVWRARTMAPAQQTRSAPAHAPAYANAHTHPLLGIGMLHGLAGSGAMAVIVPLGVGRTPWNAALWLALFGAGTVVAMALIAGAAGWSLRRSVQRSARAMQGVVSVAGLVSIGVGILWLMNTSS